MITYSERCLSDGDQHAQRMKRKRVRPTGTVENVSRRVEARVVRNSTRSVQIGGRVRDVFASAYQSVIRPLCMCAD